ncbi:MAG: thioredoxin family protein [Patescibacteria group bacterium]|nr:thioredoxin family protein [Patescibacteria group bacterium]
MNNNIKIQVLGSGCPTCKKLFELTEQAVQEVGLEIKVEYITDIQKMIEMGVMQSPALAINGKPVMTGAIGDKDDIKKLILNECENEGGESAGCCGGGCGCGGNCQ